MKKLLTIMLFFICCTTNLPEPTVYFMGISEEEFKIKNDGLELFDQNENGIVYLRKECAECNPQYFTFMYGKLEAITPFHAGLDKMQFDLKPPKAAEPAEPMEQQEPIEPVEGVIPTIPDVRMPDVPEIPVVPEQHEKPEKKDLKTEED